MSRECHWRLPAMPPHSRHRQHVVPISARLRHHQRDVPGRGRLGPHWPRLMQEDGPWPHGTQDVGRCPGSSRPLASPGQAARALERTRCRCRSGRVRRANLLPPQIRRASKSEGRRVKRQATRRRRTLLVRHHPGAAQEEYAMGSTRAFRQPPQILRGAISNASCPTAPDAARSCPALRGSAIGSFFKALLRSSENLAPCST